MRAFAIACLAIATVVAESDPEAYTPFQVATGQTAGGVITGVDYGHGSGLVPAVGVAPVARTISYAARPAVTYAARPAVSYTTPVVSNVAPAVVSTYNTLPYTSYAGHLGYSGLLGYNRHIVAKREADSEAEAYTPTQVALGQTHGGVITGVDYGNGVVSGYGAIGNRAVAYAATPAVSYAARPTVTYAARPAVSYTAPVVSNVAPAVVSTYNKLPYTSYAGHHLGYSGILGYNRHIVAKREADSEADAYTPAQVALGLPYANAVATGNAHNPGYITNAVVNKVAVPAATYSHVVPATTYSHAVPATTYSHAVPATTYSHAVPATTYSVPAAVRATVPYTTGYAGHLGYGYGLRSSLWA